jgi:predicted glycosyltransferase
MKKKTIWIDLDNSPHVPFFKPIIKELSEKGYSVVLTARDCAQTCSLADRHGFRYERIGRHFGKNLLFKIFGLLIRSLQLMPFALKEKPALALAHCSRSQVVTAAILGIPSVMIYDYEFSKFIKPTWAIFPDIVPNETIKLNSSRIFKYPGIKENVYVPDFIPDSKILEELGLDEKKLVITIRPPATKAHYHNTHGEILFNAVIEHLSQKDDIQMILLPRYRDQEINIKMKWPELISKGRIIIPEHVVDGLNLIWHSDLVISGGGTMNREAAALGVPVYSIFRGGIGAVDGFLVKNGKLILLQSVDDVRKKISLVKKSSLPNIVGLNSKKTIDSIVNTVVSLIN